MAEKGFAGRAMNAAYHLKALKDIVKALLQGGWASAGMQVLKHYWPQVLAAAIILLLLPVLLLCALPMTLFGFAGSDDKEITEMNAKATEVNAYFDTYETDYAALLEKRRNETKNPDESGYVVLEEGEDLEKNWFIALFTVSVGNDLTNVTKEQVDALLQKCIVCKTPETPEEEQYHLPIVKRYLPEEMMEQLNFSEEDREWANMIYKMLEENENGT